MARGNRTIAISLAAAAILAACVAPKNMIRVAPNTTADSLVFLLRTIADTGQPAESVYGLSVVRCSTGESVWTIAADGTRQIPGVVVYGRPVPGFPTRAGPEPLTPGCYEVVLTGAVTQRFDVGPGRVIRIRDTVSSRPK